MHRRYPFFGYDSSIKENKREEHVQKREEHIQHCVYDNKTYKIGERFSIGCNYGVCMENGSIGTTDMRCYGEDVRDLTLLDKTEWEKPCDVKFTLLTDERDYIYYAKETINFSNPAPNGDKTTFKYQTRPAMFGLDANCSKPLSQEEILYLKTEIGMKEFDLIVNGADGNIDFITNKISQNFYSVDLWSTLSSNKVYGSIRLENDSLTFAETCTESMDIEIKECPLVIGDSPENRGTKFETETYKRKI